MTSKQIECFITVAKTLNFTQASDILFMSQPTVSRQINDLEKDLNLVLFYRGQSSVRLTPAGLVMLQAFNELNEFMSEQVSVARKMNLGENGSLTIGFISAMDINEIFADTIDMFLKLYPNISITYKLFSYDEIESQLRNGAIDVAFIHDFAPLNPSEFLFDKVCHTQMYLLYGNKHSLATKENLCFEDFKNETFYTAFPKDKIRNMWKKIFNYYDISVWKTEQISNFETALLNISMGKGVGFIDPVTLHINEKTFSRLNLPDEISSTSICITWRKKNFNPTIPLFTKLLTDAEEKRMKKSHKNSKLHTVYKPE